MPAYPANSAPLRFLLLACLALAMASIQGCVRDPAKSSFADSSVISLRSAELYLTDVRNADEVGGEHIVVSLPDIWPESRKAKSRWGWYQLQTDLKERPLSSFYIYIPRASRNAAVYVNGVFVGSGGPVEDHSYRNWNRTHYYPISPNTLRAGTNLIEIRLSTSEVGKDGLSTVHLGPDEALRPTYEARRFHQITFPWIQNGINLFLAVFVFMLWFLRRERTEYLFFALALVCWTARNLVYLQTHNLDISDMALDMLQAQLFNGVFAFLALFSVRFIGVRSRTTDIVAIALFVVPPVLALVLPASQLSALRLGAYAIANVMGLGVCVLLGRAAWQTRSAASILLFVAAVVMVLIGARDVSAVTNKFGFEALYYLQYAALPLFLAIGWGLLRRLLDSLREVETLNRSLEARVAEKHVELETNYARLHEIERAAAVAEERARVMRDMHDGMGSQLMTTLALVENKRLEQAEVVEALRGCIDDMRLTIDSLQPDDSDLVSLLGNLRYRLEPRLQAAGIELDWRVADLPPLDYAGPHALLQVLRIVQEAFTNVLKHSGANRVVVEAHLDAQGARLSISDNGRGIGASGNGASRGGRGLANMQQRARGIGAELEIRSVPGNHCVELRFTHAVASG
jgi:signal transduction histidine kinase